MVSCLIRLHLPLIPTTYGWQKEDYFCLPVWFEGNTLPSTEELTSISLWSIKIDNQKLDIVAENEWDIEDSEDEQYVLSGDEPGANSDIEQFYINIEITFEQVYVSHYLN